MDCFCGINVGRGVGSGLVVNGKLFHGPQYVAGEIGHTVISVNGRQCKCGNKGCLETFVSSESIVKRAKKQISQAPENLTAEDVYHYAVEGNKSTSMY